jgi:hypothetical protein
MDMVGAESVSSLMIVCRVVVHAPITLGWINFFALSLQSNNKNEQANQVKSGLTFFLEASFLDTIQVQVLTVPIFVWAAQVVRPNTFVASQFSSNQITVDAPQ